MALGKKDTSVHKKIFFLASIFKNYMFNLSNKILKSEFL